VFSDAAGALQPQASQKTEQRRSERYRRGVKFSSKWRNSSDLCGALLVHGEAHHRSWPARSTKTPSMRNDSVLFAAYNQGGGRALL